MAHNLALERLLVNHKPVLLIGASGAVGGATLPHLIKAGVRVRALTSSEGSAARLNALGVTDIVIGDMRVPDDLHAAMDGAGAVHFTPPRFTEDEAEIGKLVIAVAKDCGTERFVLTSVLQPQLSDLPHHRNKLETQEALLNSGLEFVILQPAMFMQNLSIEWPRISKDGVYARPYSPDRTMALIDTNDLGEVAAISLIQPQLAWGTFELCAPDRLTHREMAEIIGEELGRPVAAMKRDPSDWQGWAIKNGWKPWAVHAYLAMCAHYDAHGYVGGNATTLRAILGREPTSYRAFVQRLLQSV
ncbi:NmrA family NAD(P)-binding protein [Sphingobium sp.]|uniref:SDR family oxidoreductase n=1 Tax=Sphingobium sp. TaxID=1912891 RepID=UPI0028BECD89|nr:NmrA family NAD(P)-binding protein [Sphingobium sp.]